MISVIVADDHAIVRTGIRMLINSQSDMEVIAEAEDGEEAVQLALNLQPDVVVMDLNMPHKNGILASKQITESNSGIRIVVLTMHDDKEYIFRVLQAGASSYLLKSHHDTDLLEAIRAVHRGEAYLYPNATKLLLESYIENASTSEEQPALLTSREEEVLSYLAKGFTNREAAEKLFLSTKTVEAHRSKIMDKLNLKTRPALVEYALKNGFLDFS